MPDESLVAEIPWWHSIDLGGGVITPGAKSADQLAGELANMRLPGNLAGLTVLDIGAWDGYFAFAAESLGADRVVALDSDSWATRLGAYKRYREEELASGRIPRPAPELDEVWDPEGHPGRAGFDLARRRRQSTVEPVMGDFMTIDLDRLGRFDLVFFLGVLYHLENPFLALKRLRQVTQRTAIIETSAMQLPDHSSETLWMFVEGGELNRDPTNWWVPNAAGLLAACRAAGFRNAHVLAEPDCYGPPIGDTKMLYGRLTVRAEV